MNFTIDTNGLLTNNTFLALGLYVIQLNVSDGANVNSIVITVAVQDTIAPAWNIMPINQNVEYSEPFSYVVKASDCKNVIYSVSDTTNFAIDANGLLTNNSVLAIGVYCVQLSTSDGMNVNSTAISINVRDTIAPTWDQIPTDQVVEYGSLFHYNISASDLRIVIYSVSDTRNFAIDTKGTLTNNTALAVGLYYILLTASDGTNTNSTMISVTVQDTSSTTTAEQWWKSQTATNLYSGIGGLALGVCITIIVFKKAWCRRTKMHKFRNDKIDLQNVYLNELSSTRDRDTNTLEP
jgi:hypothetical protein